MRRVQLLPKLLYKCTNNTRITSNYINYSISDTKIRIIFVLSHGGNANNCIIGCNISHQEFSSEQAAAFLLFVRKISYCFSVFSAVQSDYMKSLSMQPNWKKRRRCARASAPCADDLMDDDNSRRHHQKKKLVIPTASRNLQFRFTLIEKKQSKQVTALLLIVSEMMQENRKSQTSSAAPAHSTIMSVEESSIRMLCRMSNVTCSRSTFV